MKVLSINHKIEVNQILALNKFSKRIDSLFFGQLFLSFKEYKITETKLKKIGTIFGNRIRCLYLRFSNKDKNTNIKTIALLKKLPKLEVLKIMQWNSIDNVVQYIPKSIRVLDTFGSYFKNPTQYRQQFKDMIQRIENKFTVFRIYYPLDTELIQILKYKLDAKFLTIKLSEIPIEYIFHILIHQKNLRNLIINWRQINSLNFSQDLSSEYHFSRLQYLGIINIKVNEHSFKTVIKCFPNISLLYLRKTKFICDCNQWSTLCVDCSYKCFDILTKFCVFEKSKDRFV